MESYELTRPASRHLLASLPRHPYDRALGRYVHAAQMALEGGDIAFAKTPLAALFKCREEIAPRELIDRVGTQVEEEGDLSRVEQDIVLIGHGALVRFRRY